MGPLSRRERKFLCAAIAVLLSCVIGLGVGIVTIWAGAAPADCLTKAGGAFVASMTVTLALLVYLTV